METTARRDGLTYNNCHYSQSKHSRKAAYYDLRNTIKPAGILF
jgi:hypothetical protein